MNQAPFHAPLRSPLGPDPRLARNRADERERGSRRLLARALACVPLAALALLASCSSGGGGGGVKLSSIAVTPTHSSVAAGTSRQMKATGLYSDKSTQDLTKQVAWSSSDGAVSTVSNAAGSKGVAMGVASGNATITATLNGLSGSTALTVSDATLVSIGVTPAQPSIAIGTTTQLTATGVFSDDTTQDLTTQVAWSSSAGAVATVASTGGNKGLATGAGVGTVTITATLFSVSGTTALTVTSATLDTLEVTPIAPSLARGTSAQFTATGIFSDATKQDLTTQVTWTSSAPTIASVSNAAGSEGFVTGLSVGGSAISAELSGVTGVSQLTVTPAALVSIEVSPPEAPLALGTSQQLSAVGVYSDNSSEDITKLVLWSSADEGVVAVSNATGSEGLATSVGLGTTTVTAELSGHSGSTDLAVSDATLVSIDVSPVDPSIAVETMQQFTALGTYSDSTIQDLTDQVAWSSSDEAVAAVSNAPGSHGFATSVSAGSATISAALSGVNGSSLLTVTPALLVSIEVTPANPSVAAGTPQVFTATGTYSDASTQDLTEQAVWLSSDSFVAGVSNAPGSCGVATTLNPGSANISATFDGVSGGTDLTVTGAVIDSIVVTPDDLTLPAGYTAPFTATANYTDNSSADDTKDVIWSSSNTAQAKVSNSGATKGLVTGVSAGAPIIKATFQGVSGSTTLMVSNESLTFIDVQPETATLGVGETEQLTATGNFSGGTTLDITTQVNWFSSKKNIATAGNGANKGLVTAKSLGSATIRAKKAAKNDTCAVTVQ
jgi:trimeric autotransporter adhesin